MEKSWSCSPGKLIELTHVWKIPLFSKRTDLKLISSSFSSLKDPKNRWRLKLWPKGDEQDEEFDPNYVELFLYWEGDEGNCPDGKMQAMARFCILNAEGNECWSNSS